MAEQPDPHERCSGCDVIFGYPTEEDRALQCLCEKWWHWHCLERHVCPQMIRADQAKLRAWTTACADGRKP